MSFGGGEGFVGAGFDGRFQHGVGVAGIARIGDRRDAAELEGHRSGLAQSSAIFGEGGADIRRGAVAVVGQRLDDDGDAAGAEAFVAHLFIILGVAALALLDGALDHVLGHALRLGREDGGAEARIVIGIGQALLGGDRDFAAQLGEQLGALGILLALAEHDVLELGMAGHSGLFGKERGSIAGSKPLFQASGRTGVNRPPTRTGEIVLARPVWSSVSTKTAHNVAGPAAGVKRPPGILVVKRWSGSAFSIPMTES